MLAGHLEGAMNGMFVTIVGSVALAMLVAVVLLLIGLRRSLAPSPMRATV